MASTDHVGANPEAPDAQHEYPDARHERVHQLIDHVLRALDVAVVEVDTRVDPRNEVGRRAVDVEAVLADVDAVATTRMHGLVLALRHGVPAVAVDAGPGGAKVSRQGAVLGWPAVQTVDAQSELLSQFTYFASSTEEDPCYRTSA